MIWSLLSWLSQHPAQVVGGLLVIGGASYVIGWAVWGIALAHEERKEAEKRKRFEALLELSDKAHGKPRAPGMHSRRIS